MKKSSSLEFEEPMEQIQFEASIGCFQKSLEDAYIPNKEQGIIALEFLKQDIGNCRLVLG